jgi:hypothetical protein
VYGIDKCHGILRYGKIYIDPRSLEIKLGIYRAMEESPTHLSWFTSVLLLKSGAVRVAQSV